MEVEEFGKTKISVVIPVYNEKNTLNEILKRVQTINIPKEIILVDDFPTDGTRDILKQINAIEYDSNKS